MPTRRQTFESYRGHECLIDAIRMVGHWTNGNTRANTLAPHLHKAAFEICYVADGRAQWWIEDQSYTVERGQFFLTKPLHLHGSVPTSPPPSELYWIQVDLSKGAAIPGLTEEETASIETDLQSAEHRVFDATVDACTLFDKLLGALDDQSAYGAILLRDALHALLIQIVRDCAGKDSAEIKNRHPHSAPIAAALRFIEDNLSDDHSVEAVAAACGLSVSYFQKLFAEQVGFTPNNYRLRRRVERAKQRLFSEEGSISDIAFDLGFSSSQYFATVFKEITGMTPGDYRQWSRHSDPFATEPEYDD
jgi:AraC-like DNA-binding protein/mannose-6-phosphate isomerase-like protein (cupin superfamily)